MSWPRHPVKHLAEVSVSNVDKKSAAGEIPVRLVNYTDVYYGDRLMPSPALMEATASPRQIEVFRLRPGDVVITKDSETAEDIGVPAYVEASADDMVLGYHVALLRPRQKLISGRYLYWAMCADDARGQLSTGATGVTRFGLRTDVIRSTVISAPTAAEQKAIADFLDTETTRIDVLITKKRRMIDLLEERKTATMLAAVGGVLGHSGSLESSALPWLEKRPSHWDEVLLRLVATTGTGHTPSRERPDWWQDCTIPWITTGEVAQIRSDESDVIRETREKISEVGLANSSAVLHQRGTVVLCRTASAGYSAIMGTDMATSQDFATWTCGPKLRPRFLLLCLRAMRPDLLGRLATGSTHKTIYMPDIHALRIPLPPLEEQDRAVELAGRSTSGIFGAMAKLRMQLGLLQQRRQALITAAVTGELQVPGVAA